MNCTRTVHGGVFIPTLHRPLTTVHHPERSQNAHRAFHRERRRTLQIFDMSKTLRDPLWPLCDPLQPPTTYNGHPAPLLQPPMFVCILPHSHKRWTNFVQNVVVRGGLKILQIFNKSKTLWDPLRSPPDDHQRPTAVIYSAYPMTFNVLLRSSTSLWALDELYPERCSVTGPLLTSHLVNSL